MKDLGFLLPNLTNNAFTDNICATISKLIDNNPSYQICIFNNYSEKLDTKNIPIVHINQCKFFKGNLFIFDMISLNMSMDFPLIDTIYLYAQNIPWLTNYTNYMLWHKIFYNTNVKVIAQNTYINDIYSIVWKNTSGISERFDYESINKILQ